jgi:FkbM family methyltransferase
MLGPPGPARQAGCRRRRRRLGSAGAAAGADVATAADGLAALLRPERPVEVVDVGANPIDGVPPYRPLLDAGLARVTGFEPQPEALAALQAAAGPAERYLPYAVGDGGRHTLRLCRAAGMASLLEPDPRTLALFSVLRPLAEVTGRIEVETRRLDDVAEIERLDFLKLDIQGAELMVLRNAGRLLGGAVAVQTEVSFVTLYEGQPPLGEVDLELRRHGFVPHCFAELKKWPIAPCVVNGDPRRPLNQLLEADLVYVRDVARPERLHDGQLRHLALVAHHCYRSVDLALHCVMLLERRGALPAGA